MENKEASTRIDSIEKFWAFIEDLSEQFAEDEEGTKVGRTRDLDWGFDDGKWLTLIGGPPDETNWWKWREVARMMAAREKEDPWAPVWDETIANEKTKFHFVHVSRVDNMQVAFTPDDDKGRRDIQIALSPGKYLSKFFTDKDIGTVHLTERQIRDITDKHKSIYAPVEFALADTIEKAQHVYENGPGSCMGKKAEVFETPLHPGAVWGGRRSESDPMGDTAVAYFSKGNKIVARAVVNVNRKQFVRVYSDDIGAFEKRLQALGYSKVANFVGVRLPRVEYSNGDKLVVPYVDGNCQGIKVFDNYIQVNANDADYSCSQYGFIQLDARHKPKHTEYKWIDWHDREAA